MPVEKFIDRKFKRSSLAIIEQANEIIDEYRGDGFVLTLRQLYYQFVARGLIENKQSEYKRIGSIISDARLAGLVDWQMIEDRTRGIEKPATWDNPQEGIQALAEQFRRDIWATQSRRVEVWVEKEALIGVFARTCDEFRVPYLACRGNTSQSELWRAGKRFLSYLRQGQKTVIFHFGDHDPNGIDMTRDNQERSELFTRYRRCVDVQRLALNMDQVEQYNPPPNPAKDTDTRFASYVELYGEESWELDALDPHVIDELLRENIEANIDRPSWDEFERDEENERRVLMSISDDWTDIYERYSSDD